MPRRNSSREPCARAGPQLQAWELAAGGLVALGAPSLDRLPRWLSPAAGWLGMGAIVASAFVFSDATPFPGWAALVPVGGAVLVIVGGTGVMPPRAGPELLLGTPPFQAVGRMSYSLYLWHYPILVLAPLALGHALGPLATVLAVALACIAATASFYLVESPIRHMKSLVAAPRRGLGLGVGLASSAAAVGLLVPALLPSLVGTGAPAPLLRSGSSLTVAQVQARLAASLATRALPDNLEPSLSSVGADLPIIYGDGCHLGYGATSGPACVFGDPGAHDTVVLLGDSHAAQWFPALEEVSVAEHWRLISLTKSGCPPPDVTVPRGQGALAYPQCDTWRAWAVRRIAQIHPMLVVVSWERGLAQHARPAAALGSPGLPVSSAYGSAWLDGAAETFMALRAAAGHVVFISDTPFAPASGPSCIAGNMGDVQACNTPLRQAMPLPRVKRREIAVAHELGVIVVDPTRWFCTAAVCPVIVGNVLVYRDTDHVVPQYVEWLAPLLSDALAAATGGATKGA